MTAILIPRCSDIERDTRENHIMSVNTTGCYSLRSPERREENPQKPLNQRNVKRVKYAYEPERIPGKCGPLSGKTTCNDLQNSAEGAL